MSWSSAEVDDAFDRLLKEAEELETAPTVEVDYLETEMPVVFVRAVVKE